MEQEDVPFYQKGSVWYGAKSRDNNKNNICEATRRSPRVHLFAWQKHMLLSEYEEHAENWVNKFATSDQYRSTLVEKLWPSNDPKSPKDVDFFIEKLGHLVRNPKPHDWKVFSGMALKYPPPPPPPPPTSALRNSPFSRLPKELRDYIFELSFTPPVECMPAEVMRPPEGVHDSHTWRHWYFTADQPAITKVCKQIRSETLKLWYGANSFSIDLTCGHDIDPPENLIVACDWLLHTPIELHQSVTKLKVHFDWCDQIEFEAMKRKWAVIATLLRGAGYQHPRLEVCFHTSDCIDLFDNEKHLKEHVSEAFGDVGLKINRWNW